MNRVGHIIKIGIAACTLLLLAVTKVAAMTVVPQDTVKTKSTVAGDSLKAINDSVDKGIGSFMPDEIIAEDSAAIAKLLKKEKKKSKRDWSSWHPDIKRAMWMAIVIPGGGQIYNRKYWKLPIIYGGFLGCYYAMRWNGMMYKDYSQAYLDLMDDNPETQSYNQFMHLGRTIDENNKSTYENKFKRRKDYYRRYRDLSAFIMIGVYALSIIDAYVDASLSEFDISDDLSMRVTPAVIKNGSSSTNLFKSAAVGVHCALNF